MQGGYAHTLYSIHGFHTDFDPDVQGSVAQAVEEVFCSEQCKPGSRHLMFHEVFGHNPCAWRCI